MGKLVCSQLYDETLQSWVIALTNQDLLPCSWQKRGPKFLQCSQTFGFGGSGGAALSAASAIAPALNKVFFELGTAIELNIIGHLISLRKVEISEFGTSTEHS